MFVCITYVYVCKHVYIGEASQMVLMVKNLPDSDFPYTFFLLLSLSLAFWFGETQCLVSLYCQYFY